MSIVDRIGDKAGIGVLVHVGGGEWDNKLSIQEQRFAELLINECLSVIVNAELSTLEEKGRTIIINRIKEHFEIE